MSYTQPEASSAESRDPNANSTEYGKPDLPQRRHRRHRSSFIKRLQKRFRIRFRWSRVLLILIAAIAVIVVATLAVVFDSANRVQLSLSSFQRVVNSLSNRTGVELTMTDFDRLSSSIKDLEGSLSDTRARLNILRPAASMNSTFNTTLTELDAARELALAADDILTGLQPTLFFLVSGSDTQSVVTQISSGDRVVELLKVGHGQFLTADEHLSKAKAFVDALDLSSVSSNVVLDLQQLERYRDQLASINQVLINAPDFLNKALGIGGDQNYLVLSQNNDELRPSGGYLSTYGWMTVRNARVSDYSYSPTTTTSPNPPPANLAPQLNIPDWWLRYQEPIYAGWDGSWFADFPSTAKMAIWYYNTGNNPKSPVDGAISIDITGFEALLGVIGGVVVPGYDTTVTATNFRTVVYNIRDFGDGEIPHKKFLASLYQEIFTQWQAISTDPDKNTELLSAILDALQQKHIMMYFTDEQLNNAVQLLGWTGAQAEASDHDYLMIADANLGNKSNHSIFQTITYDADVQSDGSIQGHATVTYDYSAHIAADDPAVNPDYNGPLDYNNLLQFFVPVGTTLGEADDVNRTPKVIDNATNTEFVTRTFVPFDSTQNLQFTYVTKPLIETLGGYKRYRLLVQKQPGTPANSIDVQVSLPPGSHVINTTPDASASYNLDRPILEFRSDLSVDRWIEIIYKSG
ncbi:MAG: DUF4012 domain-containing protein [Chloroflexota bacterium]